MGWYLIPLLWGTGLTLRGAGGRTRLWVIPSEPISCACPYLQGWTPVSWTKWDSISSISQSLQPCDLTVMETQDALCKQQIVHTMHDDILGVKKPDFAAVSRAHVRSLSTQPHYFPVSPRGDASNLHLLCSEIRGRNSVCFKATGQMQGCALLLLNSTNSSNLAHAFCSAVNTTLQE